MNELNQYFGLDVSRSESKLSAMNREAREEVDRVLAKGALSLAELRAFFTFALFDNDKRSQVTCLDEPLVQVKASSLASSDVGFKPNKNTLRAVNIVGHYMPLVEAAQMRITQIMELMLYTGLASRVSMHSIEAINFNPYRLGLRNVSVVTSDRI